MAIDATVPSRLAPMTEAMLSVPNAGFPIAERCTKLRVAYDPGCSDLWLEPEGELLTLTVGGARLRKPAAALAQVEIGEGDFGIDPSADRKANPWMFWWMPNIDYHLGRRL